MKNTIINKLFAASLGVLTYSAFAMEDNIETVITGQLAPNVVNPYDKVMERDGVRYGLKRNDDGNGTFVNFTMITSTDNGASWSAPSIVLEASDLSGKGTDLQEDYTLSRLRAVKWVNCPATGNMSIWAKRHGVDANGDQVARKELLRAAILGENKLPSNPYTDSIIIDRPYGYSSGDLGTIVDDGTQYLVSAATDEGKINIIELIENCSDISGSSPLASLEWLLPDGHVDHREAPALFKDGDHFFITTSGKTGWRPNQQKYAYAPSLTGPWSEMQDFGDSTAYHSQLFGTRKINASDGSGDSVRLFSGTRNAATWNGSDSRRVWLPLFKASDTKFTTNYYDYIEINHSKAEVKGFHYDHGSKLNIRSATVAGTQNNEVALFDGDLSTSWYNNNIDSQTSVTFDLGAVKQVKALKLKQYDLYKNGGTEADVTLRTPRLKIETNDGSGFITVFEDIVGSITWLQPIDFVDSSARFVRLSLVENHKGNAAGTTHDFGFYEVEVWGQEANSTPQIQEDFSTQAIGQSPSNWSIAAGANTYAEIIDDNGKVLSLRDNNDSTRVTASKTFPAQQSSNLVVQFKVKFEQVGKGEYIRLISNGTMAINLVNSVSEQALAFSDGNFNDTKLANILPSTWYQVQLNINTDAQTFDVYLDNNLVWLGAEFANNVSNLTELKIGTATSRTNSQVHFDDIELKGPIFESVTPLLDDNFEMGVSAWNAVSGTWVSDTDISQVLANDSSSKDIITSGSDTWSDYSYSASVLPQGQGAGLLGRYQANNRYYQLMVYSDNTYKLSKNINNTWTLLASGSISSSTGYRTLTLSFSGSSINAYADHQLLSTVIDNSLATGKVGIRSLGKAKVDNVLVTEN